MTDEQFIALCQALHGLTVDGYRASYEHPGYIALYPPVRITSDVLLGIVATPERSGVEFQLDVDNGGDTMGLPDVNVAWPDDLDAQVSTWAAAVRTRLPLIEQAIVLARDDKDPLNDPVFLIAVAQAFEDSGQLEESLPSNS